MVDALSLLTIAHVLISLIAIVLGIPAIWAILSHQNKTKIVVAYFVFTAVTTLTGFAFPITRFTPGILFGILTLGLLLLAWVSLQRLGQNSRWQLFYLLSALGALYLNCVVLIVQSFQKIGLLHALAPTQTEPPFLIAQLLLVLAAVYVVWKGVRPLFLVHVSGGLTRHKVP